MQVVNSSTYSTNTLRQGRLGLNPSQRLLFDELLQIGKPRPVASPTLADYLRAKIIDGTSKSLDKWTENRLFIGKSQLVQALSCEGLVVANAAERENNVMHQATAVGIATHKAIQLAHTHPGKNIIWYVDNALISSREESNFSEFWEAASIGIQSDVKVQALSKTTGFLDTFPPLDPAWGWRFEESIQAKVGKLTIGGKVDLTLGRPRSDGRQTILLCDFKTGALKEDHDLEAGFYALISTLRNGVPPFRSTVLSLSSGEWSHADIDESRLLDVADSVILAVEKVVSGLTEERELVLTGGFYCRYCPSNTTCTSSTLL